MLGEALESVMRQDIDAEIEVLVVDDHSADGTCEWVRARYPDFDCIRLDRNEGNYAARNAGLKRASGTYIAFLDDDDLWEESYLRTQVSLLESEGRRALAVSDVVWDTTRGKRRRIYQRPDLERYRSIAHHFMSANFIWTLSSVVLPHRVVRDVGVFDSGVRIGADAEYYLRAVIAGYEPVFSGLPLVVKRQHAEGQLSDAENLALRRELRLQRARRYYPVVAERARVPPLSRILAEIEADLAMQYLATKKPIRWGMLLASAARHESMRFSLGRMAADVRR